MFNKKRWLRSAGRTANLRRVGKCLDMNQLASNPPLLKPPRLWPQFQRTQYGSMVNVEDWTPLCLQRQCSPPAADFDFDRQAPSNSRRPRKIRRQQSRSRTGIRTCPPIGKAGGFNPSVGGHEFRRTPTCQCRGVRQMCSCKQQRNTSK